MANIFRVALVSAHVIWLCAWYVLAPPLLLDKDGSRAWHHTMTVKSSHSRSFLAYRTKYDVGWGGIGGYRQMDYFLKLTIWNGYGIADVKVAGISNQEGTSPDYFAPNGLGISTDWQGRYRLIYLRPTSGERKFDVEVTDKFGNVSTALVEIPPNEYLSAKAQQ